MIDDFVALKDKYNQREVTDIIIKWYQIREHIKHLEPHKPKDYYDTQAYLRVENYLRAKTGVNNG